jgi:hypothetical protein
MVRIADFTKQNIKENLEARGKQISPTKDISKYGEDNVL